MASYLPTDMCRRGQVDDSCMVNGILNVLKWGAGERYSL
jgi:hypothetical protein